jgi:hypothetical protein
MFPTRATQFTLHHTTIVTRPFPSADLVSKTISIYGQLGLVNKLTDKKGTVLQSFPGTITSETNTLVFYLVIAFLS